MPLADRTFKTARIRWVQDSDEHPDDGHFEAFCYECYRKGVSQAFWPISLDFWNPHNMSACRACVNEKRALNARRKRNGSIEHRRAQNRINMRNLRERRRMSDLQVLEPTG